MSSHSFAHRRQSLRLNSYDYSRPGAYFVTICTFRGRNLFGEIHNREMFLNDAGRIVERTWLEIPGSLPTIIRSFKSAATKRINDLRGIKRMVVWQRNYYEHVIWGNKSLNRIGKYIRENPIRWADDPENT